MRGCLLWKSQHTCLTTGHRCVDHGWARLVQAPGDLILVAGATGGVGQILTAKLLEVAMYCSGPLHVCCVTAWRPWTEGCWRSTCT